MMIFVKGKQRESLPRNVGYVILTALKVCNFCFYQSRLIKTTTTTTASTTRTRRQTKKNRGL